MRTIPIQIDKKKIQTLLVTGEVEDTSFIIHRVESVGQDLSEVLEWANSKPAGTILSIIEELVKEQL